MVQPLQRTVRRFLRKLNLEPPHDPAAPLLGISPDKTLIQRDPRPSVSAAALPTTARLWKQPKCPRTEEWGKKMWDTHAMEHCSAEKKKKRICHWPQY